MFCGGAIHRACFGFWVLQEEQKDLKELEMEKRLYPPAGYAKTWPQAELKSILPSAGIIKIHTHVRKVSLVEIGPEQVETGERW